MDAPSEIGSGEMMIGKCSLVSKRYNVWCVRCNGSTWFFAVMPEDSIRLQVQIMQKSRRVLYTALSYTIHDISPSYADWELFMMDKLPGSLQVNVCVAIYKDEVYSMFLAHPLRSECKFLVGLPVDEPGPRKHLLLNVVQNTHLLTCFEHQFKGYDKLQNLLGSLIHETGSSDTEQPFTYKLLNAGDPIPDVSGEVTVSI